MATRGIALNFFELSTQDFSFTIHTRPYSGQKGEPGIGDGASVRRLPVSHSDEYRPFWTSWHASVDTRKVSCHASTNIYLTIDLLRRILIKRCNAVLNPNEFIIEDGFIRRVHLVLQDWDEGTQVVSLEPYYLKVASRFGFLVSFRFLSRLQVPGSIREQQLSLSLDENGHSNRNYYADCYDKVLEFVSKFRDRIFPFDVGRGQFIDLHKTLSVLTPNQLAVKSYEVGSNRHSPSQFMGVKNHGPLKDAPSDLRLHFVYRPEDKPLSHDLFRALRGDTYRTFSGMERMFHLPLTRESVSGTSIDTFSVSEIDRVKQLILAHADEHPVVPVIVTPFGRYDDPEENRAYWYLKHSFLSARKPIQVVAANTIRDTEKLKWSASGIALQIFAKANGIPWRVKPRHERCLIVGIGQAHRKTDDIIHRYFAYSVLTDSSGLFEDVRILGDRVNENEYLDDFASSLHSIFEDYREDFDRFVVHATFSIRRSEMERIKHVLLQVDSDEKRNVECVSIKFNQMNRFFGYAIDHNSRVPYESTAIRIARDEYLVWFEGLQYGRPTLRDRVGGPVHVQFMYPRHQLTESAQRDYLQDAINLSGANWRGFNAKSLPVSVYYAQIIAKYTKEFRAYDLPEIDLSALTPWFL